MEPSDIVVGGKYRNRTSVTAGVRIVDSIFERPNGESALTWTNAEPRRPRAGHDRGVCTLPTFACWAQVREPMTPEDTVAHEARATHLAQMRQQYGATVRALVNRRIQAAAR